MNPPELKRLAATGPVFGLRMFALLVLCCGAFLALAAQAPPAQDTPPPAPAVEPVSIKVAGSQSTNKVADASAPADTAQSTNKAPDSAAAAPGTNSPAAESAGKKDGDKGGSSDEIQLSLQGADINMIVQWLAQNTGKTVIKHPRANCQVTITSSKKMTKREAINLVYRAMALEGCAVTESTTAILVTPEGQEPKLSPELIAADRTAIPDGRQRLVKFFTLEHLQPADAKEKLRGVLSDKGTIEADERRNQLIVTDFNDNLRLVADLLREFDVTDSDLVLKVYPVNFADAEELATLIGAILNAQPLPPGTSPGPSRPSSGPSSGSSSPMNVSMPPGMNPPGSGGPTPPSSSSSSAAIGAQVSAPQVRLWPDKSANRLIVSAAKAKLPEVERLIAIMDTDHPEDVRVRILPLKNASATDLVRELAPLFQKIGGRSRRDTVEIGANDRSNSLFVLSSESNFKAFEELVATLDTEEAQEKAVQTFILKNADAQDVAKQLQELGRDQDSSSRYPFFIFSSSGSADRNRRKMSVVADRRRNALVVQAPPSQMEAIGRMIKELDEPITDDGLAPKIFHLKYVSASDIEDVLNELFLKKQQQRSYYYFYDDYPEQTADRDVGRLYGKVRITTEPTSNSIIVTSNSKENLAVVEDILQQLDQPSEGGESTLHIGLRFAKATAVANSINILFAKNGSPLLRGGNQQGQPQQQPYQNPQQQQSSGSSQAGFDLEKEEKEDTYYPWLGGQPDNPRSSDGRNTVRPVSDLVGRVRAVPDPRSNSLMISANAHFFPQILKLIEDLDAQTDQVLIEARIVEVAADYMDRLGVRWSPDGTQVFTAEDLDNSIIASSKGQYTTGFGGKSSVNQPIPAGQNIAQTLTTLRSGVLSSTISLDLLIQFLKKKTDARVLAEPQINIRDNETGRLFVGQQVPIPANNQVSGLGTSTTIFTYKDVGVVLEVTPHINSSGNVELRIHAESSTVVPGATVLGGSVFDTRNFRTDLTAKNGETLVLGGIIQKLITDTVRKTPILGDVPGLGWAFKKKDKTSREVELMVFLRPKVTRSLEESKELMDEIFKKAPRIKDWKEGIEPGKKSAGS